MGVVIEICIKYPGGPTRMTGTDIIRQRHRALYIHIIYIRLLTSLCTCIISHVSPRDPSPAPGVFYTF
jgi:hypothetical protein